MRSLNQTACLCVTLYGRQRSKQFTKNYATWHSGPAGRKLPPGGKSLGSRLSVRESRCTGALLSTVRPVDPWRQHRVKARSRATSQAPDLPNQDPHVNNIPGLPIGAPSSAPCPWDCAQKPVRITPGLGEWTSLRGASGSGKGPVSVSCGCQQSAVVAGAEVTKVNPLTDLGAAIQDQDAGRVGSFEDWEGAFATGLSPWRAATCDLCLFP